VRVFIRSPGCDRAAKRSFRSQMSRPGQEAAVKERKKAR
jgi:hypothetical protein